MSSFEKAGVLFITGLVAVILALALFGTSGTTDPSPPAGAAGETAESAPEADPERSDAGGSAATDEDLWDGIRSRVNGIEGDRDGEPPLPLPPTDGTNAGRPPVVAAREHVVRSGDRLATIAKRYLGDAGRWKAIAAANPGVDPARLRVGQKLVIPDAAGAGADPVAADSTPPAADRRPTYVVKKGDTLTSIAQRELRNGAAWRKLYDMNKHVVKNANRLPVGVTLTLPAN
jgi:nucleoid-associated protein YgaU